jgi:spore coat polysaccharide biosynthesis predicted glycosyltransferase SpsG
MEKIAFYTEANSDIGIGHLIRLYNFQKILKKKKIIWLFSGDHKIAKKILKKDYYHLKFSSINLLANKIHKILKKEKISRIFLDIANKANLEKKKNYENFFNKLKKKNYFIFSFDDPRLKIFSDVSIIPYVFDKKKLIIKNKKVYKIHGKEYFFSSSYFNFYKDKKKLINKDVKKIFIFLTGYNRGDTIRKILKNFEDTKYKIIIYSNNLNIKNSNKNIKLVGFVKNLAKYYFQSDISIVGEGLSRYETATLGVPTILIYSFEALNKNNDLAWKFINLETSKLFQDKLSLNNLKLYIENKITHLDRKKMSNNAKKNFDLNGHDRILKKINKFL